MTEKGTFWQKIPFSLCLLCQCGYDSLIKEWFDNLLRSVPELLHLGMLGVFLAKVDNLARTVECACLSFHFLVQKQTDGGVCTLKRCAYDGTEDKVGDGVEEHLHAYDASVYDTWVNGIHRDALLLYPLGKFEGEQCYSQLAIAIRPDAHEATFATLLEEVGEVESSHRMHAGCPRVRAS